MDIFNDYLNKMDSDKKEKMSLILNHILTNFESLTPIISWKQPMFTDHKTFIIGFSYSKNHIAVAPERKTIDRFKETITEKGYEHTKELFKIKWDNDIAFDLIDDMIKYNIEDKKDTHTFWRSR
jgi:uncharacterized protein